ncbi:MAG: AraC-like DNA-binding protein [Flavobacteriales bacterium]
MSSISPNSLLFNLHDMALFYAVGQYLLFALLLIFTRRAGDKSSYFLIAILLCNSLQSLDTFIIWSDQIRSLVLTWEPNLFFLGGLCFWLQGPLLYWYVSSVLYKDFKLARWQLIHILPILIAFVVLISNYYSLTGADQVDLMNNQGFMWTGTMEVMVTLRYVSVIVYSIWCLITIVQYRKQLREHFANIGANDRHWLLWVVIGMALISSWSLIVHMIGNSVSSELSNFMGVSGNYFTFIFVNSLVFISIRYTHLFDGITGNLNYDDKNKNDDKVAKPEHITRIQNYMEQEKPYLDSRINIEALAKQVSLPSRTLSRILNSHFGKNFFEFINTYRIAEVKLLLDDKSDEAKSVLNIMYDTGFSSKSSFNAIFKQYVGMTPSQYRKHRRETVS